MPFNPKCVVDLQRKVFDLENNYKKVDLALTLLYNDYLERKKK